MCSGVEAALDGLLGAVGGTDEEILLLVALANRVEARLVERVGAFDAAEGWPPTPLRTTDVVRWADACRTI
ncbi:MAG: hypothetical protein WKF86_00920 [Acidimicrobiales bacterium]